MFILYTSEHLHRGVFVVTVSFKVCLTKESVFASFVASPLFLVFLFMSHLVVKTFCSSWFLGLCLLNTMEFKIFVDP